MKMNNKNEIAGAKRPCHIHLFSVCINDFTILCNSKIGMNDMVIMPFLF